MVMVMNMVLTLEGCYSRLQIPISMDSRDPGNNAPWMCRRKVRAFVYMMEFIPLSLSPSIVLYEAI
jgi:hypothetical protein